MNEIRHIYKYASLTHAVATVVQCERHPFEMRDLFVQIIFLCNAMPFYEKRDAQDECIYGIPLEKRNR